MIYGQRPDGMTDEAWMTETQCRHVAREMRQGRNKQQRLAIFDRWQQTFPEISKARVAEIWREGVPMP